MASEPPQPQPPPPSDESLLPKPVEAWAGRVVQSRWINWLAGLTLLGVVATISAYLITPGLGQGIPYGDSSIGELSRSSIKALRDFDIPDEVTTQRQRDDAAFQVRPVYDYDALVAQGALSRIRAGFSRMQEAIYAARARLPPPAPEPVPDLRKKPGKVRRDDAKKEEAAREVETPTAEELAKADLLHEMDLVRDDFFRDLQITLEEEDLKALEEAQFSGEVERAVEKLLKRYQDQMIATAGDELAALGNRGITVRLSSSDLHPSEAVLLGPGQLRAPGERAPDNGPQTVSEVPDQDQVRAQVDSADSQIDPSIPPNQRKAIVHLVKRLIRPNLIFKQAETNMRQELARMAVKPVVIQLKKGDKIISAGERIDKHHALIFAGMRQQTSELDRDQVRVGSTLLAGLVIAVLFMFGRGLRSFKPTRKDLLFLSSLLVGMLALVDISLLVGESIRDRVPLLSPEAMSFAIPFCSGAMLVRLVLGTEEAFLFSSVFSLLCGVLAGNSLTLGMYCWISSLVGAHRIVGAKDRGSLFRAGFGTGVVNAALVLSLQLLGGKFFGWETAQSAFAGFIGGQFLAPVVVMAITPIVEWLGGYVTDVKLLELANLNHPALKELIVQAPGTYHHSIIMGSLVEAAAQAIGANPLLARVCAYYHDIGKGKNPLYFGENQKGENRHDKLAPQMSAVIIKRHVLDGIEMAKQYKLPRVVADAIPQHHGTRLVGYFFHKAQKEQEGKEDPVPVDEATYRYPGPKPQVRETALVMIADAVEAASRAMPDQTDAGLQALVQRMINLIFADGQLDECDLTLRDLNVLARTFYQTLRGIYHTRPEYPAGALNPKPESAGLRPVESTGLIKKIGA